MKDNSEAQEFFELGTISEEKKEYEDAFKAYEQAANMGHVLAMIKIGIFYKNGLHGESNLEKAKEYFESAVQLGSVLADYYLGEIFFENKNWITVEKHFNNVKNNISKIYGNISHKLDIIFKKKDELQSKEEEAKSGNIDALKYVIEKYHEGKIVERDEKKILECFSELKKFAENGDLDALECVINFYREGTIISRDDEQINYWENKKIEFKMKFAEELIKALSGNVDSIQKIIDGGRNIYFPRNNQIINNLKVVLNHLNSLTKTNSDNSSPNVKPESKIFRPDGPEGWNRWEKFNQK